MEHDERADGVTNDVPDAIASLGERYVSLDVDEHEAFLSTGNVVLERFDARLAANRPPLVRSPSRPCLFDSVACNGKVRRPRCALRWELMSVVARIGEAPPLRPILALRSRIRDIALPDDDIRLEQYVDVEGLISSGWPEGFFGSAHCGLFKQQNKRPKAIGWWFVGDFNINRAI